MLELFCVCMCWIEQYDFSYVLVLFGKMFFFGIFFDLRINFVFVRWVDVNDFVNLL